MSIDNHGRAHRPAGSPASTGGQFAAGAAPGQAGQLSEHPAIGERLDRLSTARRARTDANVESRQATASAILAIARQRGVDIVSPTSRVFTDHGISYDEATSVSEYELTIDELELRAIDPREQWHHTTATSPEAMRDFARHLARNESDAAAIARTDLIEQALGDSCRGVDHDVTIERTEDADAYELLVALGATTDGTVTPTAVTISAAARTRLQDDRRASMGRLQAHLAKTDSTLSQ
ncbi:hypothetical protein AA0Z99_00265 [Agrococcus sp. 1P02AA]|uniref:hypothetical protein n=1 Tax=Agrococcus sp. 1P02AA TaxID=3132259 RepID=UPI0039A77A9C